MPKRRKRRRSIVHVGTHGMPWPPQLGYTIAFHEQVRVGGALVPREIRAIIVSVERVGRYGCRFALESAEGYRTPARGTHKP